MEWIGSITIGGIATSISVIVAILVYLDQSKSQRILAKRQRTYDIVGLVFQDSPVARARLEIAKWIADDKVIMGDEFESNSDDKTIIIILDYYEYLCAGVITGHFDGDYVDSEHGYRIERTFYLLKKYIAAREDRLRKSTRQYGHDEKYKLNGAIVPIRLSPIPTTSRVLPIPRVKLGLGRAAMSSAS